MRVHSTIQSINLFIPGCGINFRVGGKSRFLDITVTEINAYSDGVVKVFGETKSNQKKVHTYWGVPYEIEQFVEED